MVDFILSAEDVMLFYGEDDDSSEVLKPRLDLAPGTSYWAKTEGSEISRLHFVCPCGCGKVGSIPVDVGKKKDRGWLWDGNETVPTLTPSVFCTGWPCRWHGYLTKGKWVKC